MFRRRRTTTPRLSVVVPVHDVEAYLSECLRSIARQPFEDIEVVVVDDGSPDRSAEIVRRQARRDPRFRLLSQPNRGLGAARNAGVAAASGELLAFCDSDDELPADAWSAMVATLDRTGSDFAVGTLVRDDGRRTSVGPRMAENHERPRDAVTVEDVPGMLADVFAVNKVYRRAFWSGAGLAFPVGTRYEDQPTLTRAFLAAERFDVLTEVVYRWRVRSDGSSITQRRHEVADLRDRVATKQDSAAQVRAHGSAEVTRVFHRDVLPVDMWEYFRSVPGCSDDYWTLLVAAVRDLWGPATVRFEETRLPARQRLMGWLVGQGRRGDLERLLAWLDAGPGGLEVVDGRLVHPWSEDPGLPAALRYTDG